MFSKQDMTQILMVFPVLFAFSAASHLTKESFYDKFQKKQRKEIGKQ